MLKPLGLTHGHYECRRLDETLPVLTDLLALRVVERQNGEAVLQHPNTAWKLVVHEGGANAPDKPHNNHYGVRVAHAEEVEAAFEYIDRNREKYGITRLLKPHSTHFARSIYLAEPGGNTLEIEYYDPRAAAEGRTIAAPHWKKVLTEKDFPGRGYVPQALTHGTLECDDKEASVRFYREVLGLEIAGGGRISSYIKHPSTPWYIVVLPIPKRRKFLSAMNRLTLAVGSKAEVLEAHREFSVAGKAMGIAELGEVRERNGQTSFAFGDLDRNWWEIAAGIV
jgi:catechol 2,3-dioxygenase-like lactoylglutathione lyase family enzyme